MRKIRLNTLLVRDAETAPDGLRIGPAAGGNNADTDGVNPGRQTGDRIGQETEPAGRLRSVEALGGGMGYAVNRDLDWRRGRRR